MRKNRRFLAIIMVLAFLGWSFNVQRVFADSEIPPEIQQEEQEVVDEEQNEEQPENNLQPENEEVIEEEPIEEEVIEEVIEEEIVEEIIEEEPIEEIVEEVIDEEIEEIIENEEVPMSLMKAPVIPAVDVQYSGPAAQQSIDQANFKLEETGYETEKVDNSPRGSGTISLDNEEFIKWFVSEDAKYLSWETSSSNVTVYKVYV